MSNLRDESIHHYMGVDYETIWNIMENEIRNLNFQLEQILKEHKQTITHI